MKVILKIQTPPKRSSKGYLLESGRGKSHFQKVLKILNERVVDYVNHFLRKVFQNTTIFQIRGF